MPFEVMYTYCRNSESEGEAVGERGPHKQRTCEARTLRIGDSAEIAGAGAGLDKRFANQRKQAANVIPRGELRDHATVRRVQGALGVEHVGHQAASAVVDGGAGFVT